MFWKRSSRKKIGYDENNIKGKGRSCVIELGRIRDNFFWIFKYFGNKYFDI